MPDAHYTDPRMAALYDTLCASRDDTLFYAALAGPAPLDVLDIGCGTGQLTEELIARGHRVTGIDPARAMLAVAQARPGAALARWVNGDARALPFAAGSFDFALLTGHASRSSSRTPTSRLCCARHAASSVPAAGSHSRAATPPPAHGNAGTRMTPASSSTPRKGRSRSGTA